MLALGHTLSNLVRTLPAVSADMIAQDLAVSAGDVAAMTSFFHLAFAAGQIPVGVALDRFSAKAVVTVLLILLAMGSAIAAFVQGPIGFVIAQSVLGAGCCGMLLCPLTLAARTTPSHQFALWSAVILAVGNSGMVLSASPMAALIENHGWRIGYGLPALFAVGLAVVVQVSIKPGSSAAGRPNGILPEVKEVCRIAMSPRLRGVVLLAFMSFAIMIGVRGMWGGPWLMETKGMSRLEAGNVLMGLTLAMITMPMVVGLIERRFGHPYLILTLGHVFAGLALISLPLGANGGLFAALAGARNLPTSYDAILIVAFGASISVQPLLMALGLASVSSQHAGKALSAVNLALFAGAAVIQSISAPVADTFGLSGVFIFLGLLSLLGSSLFWFLRRVES